ncbi:reticulon-like protein B11 isoform X2 [Vigna unguiculata]|uniref:reticulon-like protein B11 isoform X2 n=1 Tax=Vigna unguiculata TaxID=3917 RepID=UPI001015DB9B|nr:reticulon-like protein B11 isoform X2 [Vigna unguiculata]
MGDSQRISIHRLLGQGLVADVVLWKNWRGAAALLVSSSTLWYLFERAGPLPPLPDLEISEDTVARVADAVQIWMNRALTVAHDIAIERNLLLCLQVVGGLWAISFIGSLFNFLTLIYICILLSLSLPVLYDKYQDQVDDRLRVIYGTIQTRYKKIHSMFLSKIPSQSHKEKKAQ